MKLTWSIKADGDHYTVEYTLANETKAAIHVADALLVAGGKEAPFKAVPDALIVMNGDQPGRVMLAKGIAASDKPLMVLYAPVFKLVEPGHVIHGTAKLPKPLRAWHNLGYAAPLREPRTAVLQIQYFAGEPPSWRALQSETGTVRVPEGLPPTFASGAEQSIPGD